jgi:hypothetical protein
MSGKIWPGWTRSFGCASGATAAWMVVGPVGRRDAGRHAARRLDGDGEGGRMGGLIVADHHRQAQTLAVLLAQGQADETAPVLGHEVHGLRGHAIGRHQQIALVLAILVVHDHDHPPLTELFDDLFGTVEA